MIKCVVFLPTVGGSELYDGSEKVWAPTLESDEGTIYSGGFETSKLRDPSINLEPNKLLDIKFDWLFHCLCYPDVTYNKTREFFEDNDFKILQKEDHWSTGSIDSSARLFFEYPYDWRQDLFETAKKLKNFIIEHTENVGETYLVGHGMGGLLSREYLRQNPSNPHNIKKQILIGTPNHGCPNIYSILKSGKGSFFGNNTDFYMPKGEFVFNELPGIYQLLPDLIYSEPIVRIIPSEPIIVVSPGEPLFHISPGDVPAYAGYSEGTNIKSNYIAEESKFSFLALNNEKLDRKELVRNAVNFHNLLGKSSPLDNTYVIYSTELKTGTGVKYSKQTKDVSFKFNPIGDGIVPEKSAYNLDGIITNGRLKLKYAKQFRGIDHMQLIQDECPLNCILNLINE